MRAKRPPARNPRMAVVLRDFSRRLAPTTVTPTLRARGGYDQRERRTNFSGTTAFLSAIMCSLPTLSACNTAEAIDGVQLISGSIARISHGCGGGIEKRAETGTQIVGKMASGGV